MKSALVALCIVTATPLLAQPAASPPPLFTRNDAYWTGAIILGSIALSQADGRIARAWVDPDFHSPGRDRLARNFAKLQEGTLSLGNLVLYGVARLAKKPAMADITFHAAEAVVFGSLTAQLIRGPLGRARPYVSNYTDQYDFHPFQGFANFKYRAFPSIHTASAFAVATVYTLETKRRAPGATWIVGPVAYAIAAGPGIARMYNGQHWASDILAGAFLGTLAGAKVVRYNHVVKPNNRINKFFLGEKNVQLGMSTSEFSFTYRF